MKINVLTLQLVYLIISHQRLLPVILSFEFFTQRDARDKNPRRLRRIYVSAMR